MLQKRIKYISALLIAVIICMLAFVSLHIFDTDGAAAKADESEYIQINSETDWESVIESAKTSDFKDKILVLNTDLYFTRRDAGAVSSTNKNVFYAAFDGILEGNGHTLVGVSTDTPFFARGIKANGVVKNLNFVDFNLQSTSTAVLGGLTTRNDGTIQNVRMQGKLTANCAGAICGFNAGTISDCVICMDFAQDSSSVTDNDGFGSIAYFDLDNCAWSNANGYTDMLCDTAISNCYSVVAVGVGETFLPTTANRENVVAPADTLIADGKLNDIYDLFAYKKYETNATLANDINLYNTDFTWLNSLLNADITGIYGFNNNLTYTNALGEYTPAEVVGVEASAAAFASGDGTALNPYIVNSAEDLAKIKGLYADGALSTKLYFALGRDISLYDGAISKDISIANFNGEFDGRDHSISGIVNSLFDSTDSYSDEALEFPIAASIHSLYISGTVNADGEALLVRDATLAMISNVYARVAFALSNAEDTAAAIAFTASDNDEEFTYIFKSASQATTNGVGTTAGVIYGGYSYIFACKNLSDMPLTISCDVSNCYSQSEKPMSVDGAVGQSVAYYNGKSHYTSEDIYSLLDTSKANNGWAWGGIDNSSAAKANWAVLSGAEADVFVLCFGEDRAQYKTYTQLTVNGATAYRETKPFDAAGYTIDQFEAKFEAGDNVIFSWQYISDVTSYDIDRNTVNVFIDSGDYVATIIRLSDMDSIKSSATYTVRILKGDLSYQYADIRVKDVTDGNRLLYVGGITEHKPYEDMAEQPVSQIIDGVTYLYDNVTFTDYVYNGVAIAASHFMPYNALSGLTAAVSIISYTNVAGAVSPIPSEILNAGSYKLKLTLSCANYNDCIIDNVQCVIKPKKITVTPIVGDGYVYYNHALSEYLSYRYDSAELINSEDSIDLSVMDKTMTDYLTGSPEGSYYVLSALKNGLLNNNYALMENVKTYFTVKKADIDLTGVTFVGATVGYDGLFHTLSASGLGTNMQAEYTALTYKYLGTDTPTDMTSADAAKLIDVGYYTLQCTIKILKPDGSVDTNYNTATLPNATLRVTARAVSATVKDETVKFGEAAPAYEYTFDDPSLICTRADTNLKDTFSAPSYGYESNKSYTAGSNAGTYSVLISLGSLYNKNYVVTKNKGTLTVERISRGAVALANPIKKYDGGAYAPSYLSFAAEIAAMDEDKIAYYQKDGAGAYNGITALPSAVGQYKIRISFDETTNYISETLETVFEISKADIPSSVMLYFDNVALPYSLTETTSIRSYTYDGGTHTIGVVGYSNDGLTISDTLNEAFALSISYYENGVQKSSDGVITLSNATNLTAIRVILNGNDCYNEYAFYVGSLYYKPVTITLNGYLPADYSGLPYDLEALASTNADSVVLEADKAGLELSFACVLDGTPIEAPTNAGEYTVTATTNSVNYAVSSAVSFVIRQAEVMIDLTGKTFDVFYGNASASYNRLTSYSLAGRAVEETLCYIVDSTSLRVGNYDITDIEDTANVIFSVKSGSGNGVYRVNKRIITFTWRALAQYTYTASSISAISDYVKVAQADISNLLGRDYPSINVTCSDTPLNCGNYTLTAACTDNNYALAEDNKTFDCEIIPADISITVNPLTIDYLQSAPAFSAVISGLLDGDSESDIDLQFGCSYTVGNDCGKYRISAVASAANYNVTEVVPADLTVNPIAQTGVTFSDKTVVYSGYRFELLPLGTADNAQVALSQKPIDAGEYTITATITRANYVTLSLDATLTIAKATPTLTIAPQQTEYVNDTTPLSALSALTDSFTASFGGNRVAGRFAFVNGNQYIKYGEAQYDVSFVPDSANFNAASGVCTITAKLTEQAKTDDIDIDFTNGVEESDGVLSFEGEEFTLFLSYDSLISQGVEIYVNGAKIDGRFYTVTKAMSEVSVVLKKNGVEIKSYQYALSFKDADDTPPADTDDPTDDGNGEADDNNNDNNDNPSSSKDWGRIGKISGISVGGVIIVAVVAVVLINRRKAKTTRGNDNVVNKTTNRKEKR